MKKLAGLAILALLPNLSFASNFVKYDFTGVVDASNLPGSNADDIIHGSFVLNYDAPADFTFATGAHYSAVSDIRFDVGGQTYEHAGTYDWVVADMPSGDGVGFRDAVMSGGPEVNASLETLSDEEFNGTDLENSHTWADHKQKNWFVNSIQKVGETAFNFQTGGHITSVTSSEQLADAVPTPEPSSLMLFGSALIAAAGWRRRRR